MREPHDAPDVPSAISRLTAHAPFAPQAEDLMLYGRLVGAWDVDWVAFAPGGDVVDRRRGEWHFAWVLGGRAVQDVIWVAGAPAHEDGTTLRCWDEALGAWRVVFASPADGEFVTLIGRAENDRIVQDVTDPPSRAVAQRWTFADVTDDTFVWRSETSADGGATWTVTHEIRATRQPRSRALG